MREQSAKESPTAGGGGERDKREEAELGPERDLRSDPFVGLRRTLFLLRPFFVPLLLPLVTRRRAEIVEATLRCAGGVMLPISCPEEPPLAVVLEEVEVVEVFGVRGGWAMVAIESLLLVEEEDEVEV